MGTLSIRWSPRALAVVQTLIPLFLAVQFSSGVVLASMALPAATLSFLSDVFEAYGVALAFGLIGSIALLLHVHGAAGSRLPTYAVLLIQIAALAWWLATMNSAAPPSVVAGFPIFATIAIAATAVSCLLLFGPTTALGRGWTGWAHLLLIALVPLVFALRIAASLGFGMAPGPGGALEGNWLLVNAPTILLEYFAIGVWLNLLWDPRTRGLRSRWDVWLPLIVLPWIIAGLVLSSLFAFVFSAFITWGTNLAVFVPVTISLSLAAAAIACFVSFFLLLRRTASVRWKTLLLGTAAILLSGFYPSVVSVAGLSYGLLTTTTALLRKATASPS